MIDYLRLFFTVGLSAGIISASLYVFRRIWISKFPAEIPKKVKTGDARQDFIYLSTLKQIKSNFIPVWKELDPKYWIENIGLDGYAYLYFQRKIISMFAVFGIFCIVMYMPLKFWISNMESDETELKIFNVEELDSIMHSIFLYFFVIYCITVMFHIRKHLKAQILLHNLNQTGDFNIDTYKMRTAHVKGVFPEDRRGELVRMEIEQFLENTGGGKIVSMVNAPDFAEIMDLENERHRVENAQRLFDANEPPIRRYIAQ